MKNVLFIIGLLLSLSSFGQSTESHTCGAPTTKGHPCRNRVKEFGIKCWVHESQQREVKQSDGEAVQCTAISKSTGNRCKNRTKNANGKCYAHNK